MTFDFSRRGLLTALGFASIPATATAAVALSTAPAVVGESPELLSIGARLDQLEIDLERGERELAAAVAHYDATKPVPHLDLICPEFAGRYRNPELHLCERLYDSVHDARNDYWQFYSHQLRQALDELPKRSRSARAKLLHHRLALAKAHEAARDAAWDDFNERRAGHSAARAAIEELSKAVASIEPRTIVGVVIKARVMIAATRIEGDKRMLWHTRQIGPGLAADLVRIAGTHRRN